MQIFAYGKQCFYSYIEFYVIHLKKPKGKNLIIVVLILINRKCMDLKDESTLKTLYCSLVRSNLEYCSYINKLEIIQHRATKFILKMNEPYDVHLSKLNLLTLEQRCFIADVTKKMAVATRVLESFVIFVSVLLVIQLVSLQFQITDDTNLPAYLDILRNPLVCNFKPHRSGVQKKRVFKTLKLERTDPASLLFIGKQSLCLINYFSSCDYLPKSPRCCNAMKSRMTPLLQPHLKIKLTSDCLVSHVVLPHR